MSSLIPDAQTIKVRGEIARAREILRARAERVSEGTPADDAYLRRYLKVLSVQAVGQFSRAMAALADGLTALANRHAAHGERLTAVEQDLLSLVGDLGRDGWPADRMAAIEARLSCLEGSGAGNEWPCVDAGQFYEALALRLAEATREHATDAVRGVEIGCTDHTWHAAAARVARVHLEPLHPEVLASVPAASVTVVSAIHVLDAMGEDQVARVLPEMHRVLGDNGVCFAVVDRVLPTTCIERPRGRRAVGAPGVLAELLSDAGFARVFELSAGPGTAQPRVVIGRKD